MISNRFQALAATTLRAALLLAMAGLWLESPRVLPARVVASGQLAPFAPTIIGETSAPRAAELSSIPTRHRSIARPASTDRRATDSPSALDFRLSTSDSDLLPGGGTIEMVLAEGSVLDLPLPPLDSRYTAQDPSSLRLTDIDISTLRPTIVGRGPAPLDTRPGVLPPLYLSFATLQVLDVYTTWQAVSTRRAREVNPVLGGIAGNLPALVTTKAAATTVSVYAVERLWKRNRKAAVITMVGVNAAYLLIVSNNFRVLETRARPATARAPHSTR